MQVNCVMCGKYDFSCVGTICTERTIYTLKLESETLTCVHEEKETEKSEKLPPKCARVESEWGECLLPWWDDGGLQCDVIYAKMINLIVCLSPHFYLMHSLMRYNHTGEGEIHYHTARNRQSMQVLLWLNMHLCIGLYLQVHECLKMFRPIAYR